MFSQYFGNYLLNRGLITSEQLHDALEIQSTTHVKLGVLAVNEGFMTGAQVEEVHTEQKQVDKRFGEIAIEKNFLTEEQLEQVLSAQKHNHLLLGQALVDRNYMTIEQFSNALNDYKKDNSLSDEEFEAIKNDNIDVIVDTLLGIDDFNKKELYSNYLSLFAKNLIRFIDDQVYLEVEPQEDTYHAKVYVYQEILGDVKLKTGIAAKKDVFLAIASIYAEEELTELDELALASVSEYLNLHNGIFLVNMSNQGTELNMNPQQVEQDVDIDVNQSVCVVKVNTSKGSFDLILS